MSKKSKKLFVVDTIVSYRMRYVIEAKSLEDAYDEVTMKDSGNTEDNFNEVSQKLLGETIIDGRKISLKKFHEMIDEIEDNEDEICDSWYGEKLIRKIDYDR